MKQLIGLFLLIILVLTAVSCGADSAVEETEIPTATVEPVEVIEEESPVEDVTEEMALEEEPEVPEAEEAPAEEDVIASAVAAEGQDTELTLENSAQLYIVDGGLEPGSEVTMRVVPESEWTEPSPEHSQIGQVVEILADGQTDDLQASLTLKIEDPNLTDEELEDVQIADYQEGSWVTLLSTVDIENRTVTATTEHFSLKTWIRRLSNSKPEVTVDVSPNIYASVSLDERTSVNIDDLVVDVYAVDSENDELTVMATYGIETVADMAIEAMNEIRDHHLKEMVISNLFEGSSDIEFAFVLNTAQALKAPKKAPRLALDGWYELPEIEPGHFQLPLRPNNLGILESPLQKITVFVRVWDSVEEDFVEMPMEVRVTGERMATPPDLKVPGPSILTLCPPQPTFQWNVQDASRLGSFGFRLVKGDDVWGAWLPKYTWSCTSEDDCNKDGPERGFFAAEWTPPEPLSDGVYSWGMVASSDEDERKFKNELSAHSDVYQFTIDSSMEGSECVTREHNVPNWVTITLEGGNEISRSDVVGNSEYDFLEWVIEKDDKEIARLDATNLNVLETKTALEDESGSFVAWVETTYDGQRKRISNEVTLTKQLSPTDFIVPDFYAHYQTVKVHTSAHPECEGGSWRMDPRSTDWSWDTSIELKEFSEDSIVFLQTDHYDDYESEIELLSSNLLPETISCYPSFYWVPTSWPIIELPEHSIRLSSSTDICQASQFVPTGTQVINLASANKSILAQVYESYVVHETVHDECGSLLWTNWDKRAYDLSSGLVIYLEHTQTMGGQFEGTLWTSGVYELTETNQPLAEQ